MSLAHDDRAMDSSVSTDATAGHAGKRSRAERLDGRRRGDGPRGDHAAQHEAAAGGGHDGGDPFFFADGERAGNVDPATMQALYYGINPPRHAEKAYQVGDSAPPLHPRPTKVGRSGTIVALATTLYNRPPFGRLARFSVCDRGGRVLHAGEVATPGQATFSGLPPGTEVLIRPETMGTMVKLLTPEQIAGATEDKDEHTGAEPGTGAGSGAAGNTDPATMQALYYGINPPRHAEKAYQADDSAPPLHPRPTTVGRSGAIVALATTIHNRPPFGQIAQFSICDRSGRVLHKATLATPGQLIFAGLQPGTEVLIRPETMGTMIKLLTPEQIAGADDEHAVHDA